MKQIPHDKELISAVDSTLNRFFERAIAEATVIDPSYRQLWEVLYGLIRSGGKRLRPRITLLSYRAFGGNDWDNIVPVAAAQELLHFSLLIHDDIIDRDFVRYGTLNVSGKYQAMYSKFLTETDDQIHFANGAALLGGDLMLSGAHQLINESELDTEDKRIALHFLSKSIFEVAGGELLDTESSFVPYTDGDAMNIASRKTAGYSFVTPLITGATLAGASDDQLEVLREFGTCLGIAYQLVDDLISVFGDEKTTGKSSVSDIREGKRTYMVEQAYASMTIVEKDKFNSIFGNSAASPQEIDYIKQLFQTTGAKDETQKKIAEYAHRSREIVDNLTIDTECKEQLSQLIAQVTERSF